MTSDKLSASMTVEALVAYGVEHVVVSPGSRDIPLIIALEGNDSLRKHVIIDERCAAFAALGMSLASGARRFDGTLSPVALVCTSGTAVLNYAPAVAEAYYRGVPLIVLSADRPAEWIDQDDSQTIRQTGVLANIVKQSYYMAADGGNAAEWLYRRTLNDALSLATAGKPGPVHINIAFDEPLGRMIDEPSARFRKIEHVAMQMALGMEDMDEAARYNKIMIVAGFMPPNEALNRELNRLAALGVAVLYEAQSNLEIKDGVFNIDPTLAYINGCELYTPQLVITIGGSLLSRHLKAMLRGCDGLQHWHVGYSDTSIDCFKHLTRRFECEPLQAITALADVLESQEFPSELLEFGRCWNQSSYHAALATEAFADDAPWCDLKAMDLIFGELFDEQLQSLHFSNGTAIRYAQLFSLLERVNIECNRGVSGIDGSTSTAMGYAMVSQGRHVLVTGDMSFVYDLGSLSMCAALEDFTIILLDNGGGGIFRYITSTSNLGEDILNRYFDLSVPFNVKQLAASFGVRYFYADSNQAFQRCMRQANDCTGVRIVHVRTDGSYSADVLREFYEYLKK